MKNQDSISGSEMKTLSGHTITKYEGERLANFKKEFSCKNGWSNLNPGNWTLPHFYDKVADKIYQYRFRDTDIIVDTCPKAGTTWVQEIIWTMKNNPNLDNPAAKLSHGERSPMLEIDSVTGTEGAYFESVLAKVKSSIGEVNEKEGIFLKFLDTLPSPRIIKSHLPLSLLPPDILDSAKVVYVARNPYDNCISYYKHCQLLKDLNFSGSFEKFAQLFMEGNLIDLPFWEHVYEAWKKKDHSNLHFVFYEDLKKDPFKEIHRLNVFLEADLTDKQLQNVVNHTSFSTMKERGVVAFGVVEKPEHMNMEQKEKEGGFLRKGIVGDWKNSSSPETIEKMKNWIEIKMKDMPIPFVYSIN